MAGDTHPDAERVQVRLFRRAGQFRRSEIASALTHRCIRQARNGIARARPDLSSKERNLFWVEIHYGKELARRVRAYLQRLHT